MRYYLERGEHSVVFAKSINDLYRNHKINFDGNNVGSGNTRHSRLDWFLVPKERPSIGKAPLKEHYIDIPGANGGLDLTESLTGFPLYEFIEDEIEFIILNDRKLPIIDNDGYLTKEEDISWELLNRDIRSFLNGQKRWMMFEDDPSWYYFGRFTVEKYDASDAANSHITIAYKVYPFKRLSTYIYNETENLKSYFDTLPLAYCDTATLEVSFWDKTDIEYLPGDNHEYKGSIAGQLPCGEEAATVSLFVRDGIGSSIKINYTAPDTTIERTITITQQDETVKLRDIVLTNSTGLGTLYSDNELKLTLIPPNDYDENNTYDPVHISIQYDIGVM